MNRLVLWSAPFALSAWLPGCEEPLEEEGETQDTCDPCALEDGNNYDYTPTLTATSVSVPAFEDVRVSWANLSVDLLGHDMDPALLDRASLLVGRDLTAEEMLEALALDRLDMSDLRIMLLCTPTDAACLLSDFGLAGSTLDPAKYFEPDSGAWLIAPGQSTEAGVASLVFLVPDPDAPPTDQVDMSDAPATLEVDADLSTLEPLYVAAESAPRVDWSSITMDALGNTVDGSRFDRLLLGRYELSIDELETRFLDLETIATQTWEQDVTGLTELDLSSLEDAPPFDTDATWLLALQCSTCMNPAPRFLTVIYPIEPS
jgi:hypothetical protein